MGEMADEMIEGFSCSGCGVYSESIQRLQLQEEVKNEQKKKELLRNDHTSVSS